jgi:hypothetical protein
MSTVDRGSSGRRALLMIGIPVLVALIFLGVSVVRGEELRPDAGAGSPSASATLGTGGE